MPKIVCSDNEFAICKCGNNEFEILPHRELKQPLAQMAFCKKCGQGKTISLWQDKVEAGYIGRTEHLKSLPCHFCQECFADLSERFHFENCVFNPEGQTELPNEFMRLGN